MNSRTWICFVLLLTTTLWSTACICTQSRESIRIDLSGFHEKSDGYLRTTAEDFSVAVQYDEGDTIPDDTIELFDSDHQSVEMVATREHVGRRQLNGNCAFDRTVFTSKDLLEPGRYRVIHRRGSAGMPLENDITWKGYDGSEAYVVDIEIYDPVWENPLPPEELEHYITGSEEKIEIQPTGPSLLLMGGGLDVDEAFVAWLEHVQGGDVVVLRTSGADGYNDYLYHDIGGINSVETMLIDSRTLANDPYVATRLRDAEGIFLAGGNQTTYLQHWRDTKVEREIGAAFERGANVGGTSAGLAVLGEFVFSAEEGTVYSDEALEDPYNPYMTLEVGLGALPALSGVITDSHFANRDRFGRLMGFLARLAVDEERSDVVGIGIDERTALVIDPDGQATVMGEGAVYLLQNRDGEPTRCEPGEWLETAVDAFILTVGDTVMIPSWETESQAVSVEAVDGALSPENPYEPGM